MLIVIPMYHGFHMQTCERDVNISGSSAAKFLSRPLVGMTRASMYVYIIERIVTLSKKKYLRYIMYDTLECRS